MSETQTETEAPSQPDPSDPAAVADQIKADLHASESRYQASLARERAALTKVQEVTQKVETIEQERDQLEFSTVANALEAAETRAEQLQADYAAAMEVGDFKRAGALSTEAGKIGARIEQLTAGKQQLEVRRQEQLNRPAPTPAVQPQVDPIEADLAGRGPEAAAWIRKHADSTGKPRFYTDPAFQQRVIGAHNLAVGRGLVANSPDYFDYVEREVGVARQDSRRDEPTLQTERSVPSAAPTRSTATYTDRSTRTSSNHISAEMARIAKQIGVTPEEYKKGVDELDRENGWKLGNPWRGSR